MKKKGFAWLLFGAIFIGILIILLSFLFMADFSLEENLTENNSLEISKGPSLYFYDNKTNCSLNGKIYSGGTFIGEVKNGGIKLNSTDYGKINPSEDFSIFGITDYCFGKNANLPFYRAWTFIDWDYLFASGGTETFEIELNPRQPVFPQEIQGFIRPNETKERLSNMRLDEEDSVFDNMDYIIDNLRINWVSDFGRFGEMEYWQTPNDLKINKNVGDCEDWAVYAVSILAAYEPSLDCYLALWNTHANVLCSINGIFIIYDQEDIREAIAIDEDNTIQDKKIKLRTWRNNYFDNYGISPNDAILIYLINQKEIIGFENGREDFIEWAVSKV